MKNPFSTSLRFATVVMLLVAITAVHGACGNPDAGPADIPGDASDTREPWPPAGMSGALPFTFERADHGEPLPAGDVTAFSARLGAFLGDRGYFDYVLRNSHGVDASTGKRDYSFWWSEVDPIRDQDKVVFRHRPLDEHGGHNVLIPNTELLAAAIAATLLGQDPSAALLAEGLCKGITALMLGMVFDQDDPIDFLMARNIIAFNHEYTTHDGRRKAVDYTPWYHPYDRWNCSRFQVPDNPYWDSLRVTNTRSKDDVGHLFRISPWIRFAGEWSAVPAVRDACAETSGFLERFARDIVDHGYFIRTKDSQGNPIVFSRTENPNVTRRSTDLDNFVDFEALWPGTECNAMRGADLLGYGDPARTECPSGAPNELERVTLKNNYPNINFFRAYHIGAVFLSLAQGDTEGARNLLEGLVQRLEGDRTMDRTGIAAPGDRWDSDLALGLLHGATVGVPLTSTEARLVVDYFSRALDRYDGWTGWNPWDPGIPDSDLAYAPARSDKGPDGETLYWITIEALAAPLEYCASPFRNPSGVAPVDCNALLSAL